MDKMMPIRVAFHRRSKSSKLGRTVLGYAIAGVTKPFNWGTEPYDHVEIWYPDRHGHFIEMPKSMDDADLQEYFKKSFQQQLVGECFTSTMRDKTNGVVCRPAAQVIGKHPSRWDIGCFEVPEDRYNTIRFATSKMCRANKNYDVTCLFTFFLPTKDDAIWPLRLVLPETWHSKDKHICSEIAQMVMTWARVFPEYAVWSPRRLSAKSKAAGIIIKPYPHYLKREFLDSVKAWT